ncbi:MAG: NERD domain-containing protein [Rheinheimera sp.]
MILKDKTQTSSASIKLDAGIKQEQDVAFYLRRAYKDRDNVMVFNDIRLSHTGENAQIDHLIVYSYGFIVVESKSIRGEIQVNEYSEWSRSYKGQWSGMPSPIKQAELQLALLKQLLSAHDSQLLGTLLGMQQGFGGRCFDVFCAISSDAIIDRSKAPIDVADKLVKSEFVVEALDKKMDFKTFFQFKARLAENRPSFTAQELTKICDFILAHKSQPFLPSADNENTQQRQVENNITAKEAIIVTAQANERVVHVSKPAAKSPSTKSTQAAAIKGQHHLVAVTCKHCGASDGLTAQSGRYGYFVQCGTCNGNTPLKRACPACHSPDTKVSKSKSVYVLACQTCGVSSEVFRS